MSDVTCHILDKVLEIVGGGSVINGATPSSYEKEGVKSKFALAYTSTHFNLP